VENGNGSERKRDSSGDISEREPRGDHVKSIRERIIRGARFIREFEEEEFPWATLVARKNNREKKNRTLRCITSKPTRLKEPLSLWEMKLHKRDTSIGGEQCIAKGGKCQEISKTHDGVFTRHRA